MTKEERTAQEAYQAREAEKASEAAARMSRTRWAKPEWQDTTKRAAFGRFIQGFRKVHKGGRPRSLAKRCPCGEMTLKRAIARAHRCSKVKSK